jgi:hypothetical protein
MAIVAFSGWLAPGNFDGSSFTEIIGGEATPLVDYQRQAIDLTTGSNAVGISYNNQADNWGLINAFGVFSAADGTDLILFWPISHSLIINRGIIYLSVGEFSLDLLATNANPGDVVGNLTPARGQQITTIYAGSFFNSTFSPDT